VQADADAGELSSITSNLSSFEVSRVVDEKPADLKGFGLDPARMDVRFKAKGQGTERRVLLGDKTPTGGDLYAKLPDSPRVFLVPSYLEAAFNKNTFALRDKAVLKVDRQKADGLELVAGATHLAFTKSGESWSFVKPFAARADYAAVEGAIERLSSAQMQGLAAEQNGPPKQYGFDAPAATMTIKTGSSSATLTLGKTENAVVFAKDASRPLVFTVAPTLRADVVKDVADFRRKDPVRLPLVHRHARRALARRGHAGVRPFEGQGRQGRVEGRRRQDRGRDEGRGPARQGVRSACLIVRDGRAPLAQVARAHRHGRLRQGQGRGDRSAAPAWTCTRAVRTNRVRKARGGAPRRGPQGGRRAEVALR
jgi:hypothetical protein